MFRIGRLGCGAGAVIAFTGAAHAELSYSAETLQDGLRIVLVSGEFSHGDDLSPFRTIVTSHKPSAVSFNSPGGNVYKAIELGRLIRSYKINTVQIRGLDCSSACALAFFGGFLRGAEPGSIGMHKSSFADASLAADDAVSAVQELTAEVIAYMSEMGVDPALLKLALRYESDDIRYLSGSEMAEYKVTWTLEQATASTQSAASNPPTTAKSVPPAFSPATEPEPSPNEIASFVRTVVESHTGNNAQAVDDVLRSYGPSIFYFGKITPLSEVIADKRSYFERWPERYYAIREPTLKVTCDSEACEVTGLMDWSVRSLPRNRKAAGSASFKYIVSKSPGGLRIVLEDSKILSR